MTIDAELNAAIDSGDRHALIRLAKIALDESARDGLTLRHCEVLYGALDAAGSVKLAREVGEQMIRTWPNSPVGQAVEAANRVAEIDARLKVAAASGDLSSLDQADVESVKRPYRLNARLIERSDLARKFSKLATDEGESVKAFVLAERAVEISDEDSNQLRLAACLRRCRLGERAIAVFDEVERRGSDSAHVAATGRAATLADLGRLDEAAKLIDAVVAARPRDPYALRCAGRVAAEQGDLSGATDYFERALEIDGGGDVSVRRQLEALAVQAKRAGDDELAARIRDLLGLGARAAGA